MNRGENDCYSLYYHKEGVKLVDSKSSRKTASKYKIKNQISNTAIIMINDLKEYYSHPGKLLTNSTLPLPFVLVKGAYL